MSRGRVNPPPVVLRVERLSDGQPRAPSGVMVDDFTGQPIEPKLMVGPTRPLMVGHEVAHQRHQQRIDNAKLLLEVVMPKHRTWPALLPQARVDSALPMRMPKPLQGGLVFNSKGVAYEMVMPKRPFRRI